MPWLVRFPRLIARWGPRARFQPPFHVSPLHYTARDSPPLWRYSGLLFHLPTVRSTRGNSLSRDLLGLQSASTRWTFVSIPFVLVSSFYASASIIGDNWWCLRGNSQSYTFLFLPYSFFLLSSFLFYFLLRLLCSNLLGVSGYVGVLGKCIAPISNATFSGNWKSKTMEVIIVGVL